MGSLRFCDFSHRHTNFSPSLLAGLAPSPESLPVILRLGFIRYQEAFLPLYVDSGLYQNLPEFGGTKAFVPVIGGFHRSDCITRVNIQTAYRIPDKTAFPLKSPLPASPQGSFSRFFGFGLCCGFVAYRYLLHSVMMPTVKRRIVWISCA